MTTTHERLMQFIDIAGYLEMKTIAALSGVSNNALWQYMKQPEKHVFVGSMVRKFLDVEGQELIDIQYALTNGAKNRIQLHRRRSEILKKVKVRQTTNHREPSVVNS